MAKVIDPREEWFWDEKIVESYESWYEGKGRRADRLEKKALGLLLERFQPIETLIEVGCGTTHFTRYFESLGPKCLGYDLSPFMLRVARKLWNGELIRGDSTRLPFQDESFDLVALLAGVVEGCVRLLGLCEIQLLDRFDGGSGAGGHGRGEL